MNFVFYVGMEEHFSRSRRKDVSLLSGFYESYKVLVSTKRDFDGDSIELGFGNERICLLDRCMYGPPTVGGEREGRR